MIDMCSPQYTRKKPHHEYRPLSFQGLIFVFACARCGKYMPGSSLIVPNDVPIDTVREEMASVEGDVVWQWEHTMPLHHFEVDRDIFATIH